MNNRRQFVIQLTVISGAALAGQPLFAQAALLAETDAQAVALGYKADTTKVDTKKYPKHEASQNCAELLALPGQGRRRGRRLPAVCGQAGRGQRLVQCVGQEGLSR